MTIVLLTPHRIIIAKWIDISKQIHNNNYAMIKIQINLELTKYKTKSTTQNNFNNPTRQTFHSNQTLNNKPKELLIIKAFTQTKCTWKITIIRIIILVINKEII